MYKRQGKRLRDLSANIRDENAQAVALLEENLANITVIKSFTKEEDEAARFEGLLSKIKTLTSEQSRLKAILQPLVQMLISICVIVVIYLLRHRFSDENMGTAEFVSFLIYAAILIRPISTLIVSWGELKHAQGALLRLEQVNHEKTENYQDGRQLSTTDGRIRLSNISYAYPNREQIFQGINLNINSGETIALLGANGAGKSTLVNLILRFIKPDSGDIMLDDIALDKIDLKSLRNHIGFVAQYPLLFDASILSNLSLIHI